jgi:hypothetical protein
MNNNVIHLRARKSQNNLRAMARIDETLGRVLVSLAAEHGAYAVTTVALSYVIECLERARAKGRPVDERWIADCQRRLERLTRPHLPSRPRLWPALLAIVLLGLCASAPAQQRRWFDVPAVNETLGHQVLAVAGRRAVVMFSWDEFDWDSPATVNVRGWFTVQQALCLALSGTREVPVPIARVNRLIFALQPQRQDEPQHCQYASVDYGPEWIHAPQADWK